MPYMNCYTKFDGCVLLFSLLLILLTYENARATSEFEILQSACEITPSIIYRELVSPAFNRCQSWTIVISTIFHNNPWLRTDHSILSYSKTVDTIDRMYFAFSLGTFFRPFFSFILCTEESSTAFRTTAFQDFSSTDSFSTFQVT